MFQFFPIIFLSINLELFQLHYLDQNQLVFLSRNKNTQQSIHFKILQHDTK